MKTIKAAQRCPHCDGVLWTTSAELARHAANCKGDTVASAYQKRKNGGRPYRDKRGF